MKLPTDQRKALTEAYKNNKPKRVLTIRDYQNGKCRTEIRKKIRKQGLTMRLSEYPQKTI